jgi:hypothetical protein
VDEDYTRQPKEINGSPYKLLTGVIQTLEYERMIATLCLVYGVSRIKTMMSNNRWSFSSRPGTSNRATSKWISLLLETSLLIILTGSSTRAQPSGSNKKKLSPANAAPVGEARPLTSAWKIGYTFDEDSMYFHYFNLFSLC